MTSLLHTEGLAIGHARTLMSGIGLHLAAGEVVALLGANGIGKSTLLNTLSGALAPRQGRVLVQGSEVHALAASARARLVSVVLTDRSFGGMVDVGTVVGLGRIPWTGPWGRISAVDEQVVQQALERTGAEGLRRKVLAECSDGECQQVMIARALAQATPVMLLDEPTAFLDLPNRVRIVRLLRSIAAEEAKAVLFSTHDLQLALDLSDRIILLRRDAPLWQGTAAEVRTSGELEAAFAGSGIAFDRERGTHRFIR